MVNYPDKEQMKILWINVKIGLSFNFWRQKNLHVPLDYFRIRIEETA